MGLPVLDQGANRMNNKDHQRTNRRTKGRRLPRAQVDVLWSVCHFRVYPPALLRKLTDSV